ncbi:helix-turn-helix transcriptional regulator [Parasutterella secunda]|jgi:transcriptional regulator with XRE-family HTH domain|uniref:helix-turn-helix domain-containing protein n=1 Tax=Parasutterella secunda TaxID=626947 RepID=UPI0003403F42|nr:helix-turn-helix transcriptional regulator [Parasutterella secunda]CDE77915.1 phage-related DNA-binding protein [Sutterella sp. CAG:521]HIR22018.1 helix-turn-helix transcriptional regulator [Candidatus Aphodousia faecalis]HJI93540.1 helix-turn-helix transcriptional regulator [Sutterellaceae bacterium]MCL1596026.1 helix-turn-helix transcriptional regulator [Parasutterella secunda]MCR8920343.1 helix-turn-helix transcriptional regulator [Parasutterella secunda]
MATVLAKRRREFGERLRTERERLGYTELQIAQLLGVPLEMYQKYELGQEDPGIFRMPRLNDCGFDILFIITSERHNPVEEESELLARFRELSNRGRDSIFMTLDALERLAPNLRQTIRNKWRNK